MSLLEQAAAMAAKDLRLELRARHAAGVVLPFAVALLITFGLSFGPGRTLLDQIAPGLLWLAVLFSAVLAFRAAYEAEGEDDALEELRLSPVDRAAVFLGKGVAVVAQLVALEVAVAVLAGTLFSLSLGDAPLLIAASFALGTIGLAAVGNLFAVLAESARAREAIFPLLVLPVVVPVLVAGVRATELARQGLSAELVSWLGLIVAFDVLFVAAGALLFGHILED